MKEEQEQQHHQDSPPSPSPPDHNSKRKLDDNILLAKQKAQEIAARLVSNAESKRPRLDDNNHDHSSSEPLASNPPFPGT